jgi:hypothetical protein
MYLHKLHQENQNMAVECMGGSLARLPWGLRLKEVPSVPSCVEDTFQYTNAPLRAHLLEDDTPAVPKGCIAG